MPRSASSTSRQASSARDWLNTERAHSNRSRSADVADGVRWRQLLAPSLHVAHAAPARARWRVAAATPLNTAPRSTSCGSAGRRAPLAVGAAAAASAAARARAACTRSRRRPFSPQRGAPCDGTMACSCCSSRRRAHREPAARRRAAAPLRSRRRAALRALRALLTAASPRGSTSAQRRSPSSRPPSPRALPTACTAGGPWGHRRRRLLRGGRRCGGARGSAQRECARAVAVTGTNASAPLHARRRPRARGRSQLGLSLAVPTVFLAWAFASIRAATARLPAGHGLAAPPAARRAASSPDRVPQRWRRTTAHATSGDVAARRAGRSVPRVLLRLRCRPLYAELRAAQSSGTWRAPLMAAALRLPYTRAPPVDAAKTGAARRRGGVYPLVLARMRRVTGRKWQK